MHTKRTKNTLFTQIQILESRIYRGFRSDLCASQLQCLIYGVSVRIIAAQLHDSPLPPTVVATRVP